MVWKVKKEMPMGSAICGTRKSAPRNPRRVESVNVRYLKTKSTDKLKPAVTAVTSRRAGVRSRTRIIQAPSR